MLTVVEPSSQITYNCPNLFMLLMLGRFTSIVPPPEAASIRYGIFTNCENSFADSVIGELSEVICLIAIVKFI
jgi:hypothetical protein